MTTVNQSSKDVLQSNATPIEQRIKDAVAALNETLDPIREAAWYFTVSFRNVQDGQVVGRLARYEPGDMPFQPSHSVDVPGVVVGNVVFDNGRAMFDGNSYIQFHIAEEQVVSLDKAKMEAFLVTPKPMSMIGYGQIDRSVSFTSPHQNPVIYFDSGSSGIGLFVPGGEMLTKINLEDLGPSESPVSGLDEEIWFSYIANQDLSSGSTVLREEIVDPANILGHLSRREFPIVDAFQLSLAAGATFTVGYAPLVADASPYQGWLEEVIFDPTGGSNGGRS